MLYTKYIISKRKIIQASYTNMVFDDIKVIGDFALEYAFYNCTDITGSVSFPDLTTINTYGLANTFVGCTGITSVYFPKLTTIGSNGLSNAFSGCTNLTAIHYKASMQSTIGTDTFGASNATNYFDL